MTHSMLLCPEYVLRAHDHEPEKDMAVLVEDGRIAGLGSAADLAERAPSAERIDLPRCLLMPGLVNAHQHGRGVSQIPLGYPDQRLGLWMSQPRARRLP